MHIRKLFKIILPAILALLFVAESAQAQRWTRADTKNFIVYGEGSEARTEEAARNLERIDALMRMLLAIPAEVKPHRLEVYVLYDQDRVSLFAGNENVAGFYRPSVKGSFIVAHRGRPDDRTIPGQVVLFHEYAHHLMFRYFSNAYPAWYREGFAEYLSTTEFDDESFSVGLPANHRAYEIRQGSFLPLEEILVPPKEEYTGDRRYMFYPQSWLLTHYLMSDPQRNRLMSRYFEELAKGADPLAAAGDVFGNLDDLERSVKSYGTRKIDYRRSPSPIAIDGDVRVTKLDDLESDLVKMRLFIRTGYEQERTRDELRKLSREHPQSAEALVQLGEAERMVAHKDGSYDFAAAMDAVDRALAVAPGHERANLLMADLLLEADDHADKELGTVDWDAVRAFAIRANETNADNPNALYTYVDSFLRQGGPAPEVAIPAMEQVFGTVPEAVDVRVALAKLHASAGNFDRALDLVGFLVGDPHSGERGRELVAEIEAMRDNGVSSTDKTESDEE